MESTRPVLFDYWRSSASYRVRIALNLKSIAYEPVAVNLLEGQHRSAEHLARNPQGFVPVLDIDGLRLSQSLAIIEYLEETHPEPALLPGESAGRARVRALAHVIAMDIHPVCNPTVVNRVVELSDGSDETRAAWMREHIARGLDAFEILLRHSATGTYCHGDIPTLADCCLVPQVYNARRWGLEISDWPTIARISRRCEEDAAFSAAHPDRIAAG